MLIPRFLYRDYNLQAASGPRAISLEILIKGLDPLLDLCPIKKNEKEKKDRRGRV